MVWVDDGSIRLNGSTHEVVSAYESSMARVTGDGYQSRPLDSRARFEKWELIGHSGDDSHTLSDFGPVTVKFDLRVVRNLRRGVHGIALYNSERQLVWGTAAHNLELDSGVYALTYAFPTLPLRPGPYNWLVSLFDENGELDMWEAEPEMHVATENHQHPRDEWNGILNLSTRVRIIGGPGEQSDN